MLSYRNPYQVNDRKPCRVDHSQHRWRAIHAHIGRVVEECSRCYAIRRVSARAPEGGAA
jgi:hypothetical protein